ncbi:MAG: RICIN domain-containing protein, partial [Spirillospora sp.]
GARLLEIATKRVGDPERGRCTAVFGSGPAHGTGDASGVSPGTPYRLRNLASGKCVDAGAGSDPTAAPVQQWACNGLPRQDWRPADAGGGHFQLVNSRSGECLGLRPGSTGPGVAVQQETCGSADSQRWRIVNVGRGHYGLVSKPSGLCLDLDAGSPADGAKIQQWTCNDHSPQIWRLDAAA